MDDNITAMAAEPEPAKAQWYQNIQYDDAKIFIRSNITSAARSFIAIGYYLKYVRDHGMYQEDGHDTIWDFAWTEYGLSKSTASRYMSMNDRFSKDANSPYVKDEYKEFGKSQLQEMLSLSDDQLAQVSPEDRVEDIRSLRKSKETSIPYVEIPGQHELEVDFADCFPDIQLDPLESEQTDKQVFEMSVDDLVEADAIAISQQGVEHETHAIDFKTLDKIIDMVKQRPVPEFTELDTDSCPPDNCSCWRQEWGTDPEQQKAGHEECKRCWQDWKKQKAVISIVPAMEEGEEHLEVPVFTAGNEEHQESVISKAEEPVVIDAEYSEVPNPAMEEYTLEYFLKEQNQKLEEILEGFKDCEPDKVPCKMVERQKMIVCALAAMKADLEIEEFKRTYKPEQPDLLALKNNDQRGVFVDAYETWPLWIETKETGERYYKYDLPDGTSMVVKVYRSMLFDYTMSDLNYEDRFHEGYGRSEYYLLREGKLFKDCGCNRSSLIDKLKEIQKREKE